MRKLHLLHFVIGLLCLFCSSAVAQRTCQLYVTDTELNRIIRADEDGSNAIDLISNQNSIIAVRVDVANNQLYWGRNNLKDIRRANLDGSSEKVIVANPNPTGLSVLTDIQIDIARGKIYWSDQGINGISTPVIMRANLDGTSVETLIANETARSIDLDLVNQKIYFSTDSNIKRANLDGTMVEFIIHEGDRGLVVDATNGKLYWINSSAMVIKRANLDGSSIENLISLSDAIRDLTIDVEANKAYWINGTAQSVQRANLDGSMIETLIPEPSIGAPSPSYAGIELVCTRATEPVAENNIPTMSQWGLWLFGLLILNFSLLLIKQHFSVLLKS